MVDSLSGERGIGQFGVGAAAVSDPWVFEVVAGTYVDSSESR